MPSNDELFNRYVKNIPSLACTSLEFIGWSVLGVAVGIYISPLYLLREINKRVTDGS